MPPACQVISDQASTTSSKNTPQKHTLEPEYFNIENVEILWRRVPPPAPQALAKLVSP
jgi:hypothetical protein